MQVAQTAYSKVGYAKTTHSVSILLLDLSDLRTVKSFAQRALESLEEAQLDVLFLNAGMNKAPKGPGLNGSPWCEAYLVNHLCKQTNSEIPKGLWTLR